MRAYPEGYTLLQSNVPKISPSLVVFTRACSILCDGGSCVGEMAT